MGESPSPLNGGDTPENHDGPADEQAFDADRVMLDWVQDLAPHGIFSTDGALRVQSWNRWLAERSGWSAERIIGRELLEVYPDLVERRIAEVYRRALAGEVCVLATALHKYLLPLPADLGDGEGRHMLQTARVAPLRRGGRVVGTITVVEDVTQREMQAQLLQKRQLVERVLSQTLEALTEAPDPATGLADILRPAAVTLDVDCFLHHEDHAASRSLVLKATHGVLPKHRQALADCSLAAASAEKAGAAGGLASASATLSDALRCIGVQAVAAFPLLVGDRTAGMLTFGSYSRISFSDDDRAVMGRIARYVALAVDRSLRQREIEAASKAKDDFLAALSHELRAPLNPVLLMASDSAGNAEFPEPAREAFRFIERNAMLEARLIDDLLDLTKIAHNKVHLDLRDADLHPILRDAATTISSDATGRALSLQWALHAARTNVTADVVRLQQVFWNVLKNAVKFSPPGGRITITTRNPDLAEEVVVEVHDEGIGMEPEEIARIFKPFSQGDHARSGAHVFGGLGMGLAISKKLVELHQGHIAATSPGRGQGSIFSIRLPLAARGTRPLPCTASRDAAVDARAEPVTSPGRILLVEDHESTRTVIERVLIRRGYTVVAVASATRALEAARSREFDLVVSDIGLPDCDGFALMDVLRAKHGLKGVALTGYGMEGDIARGRSAGFVAHLTKPVQVDALHLTVASALRSVPLS